MNISFHLLHCLTTPYVSYTNVKWCRITENKLVIQCRDGLYREYYLKKIIDLEIKDIAIK